MEESDTRVESLKAFLGRVRSEGNSVESLLLKMASSIRVEGAFFNPDVDGEKIIRRIDT